MYDSSSRADASDELLFRAAALCRAADFGERIRLQQQQRSVLFRAASGLDNDRERLYVDIVLVPAPYGAVTWLEAYLDECIEANRALAGQEWVINKVL